MNGAFFGKDFFDFSLDNTLYYSLVNASRHADEICKAVNAPKDFTVNTVKKVLKDADHLK